MPNFHLIRLSIMILKKSLFVCVGMLVAFSAAAMGYRYIIQTNLSEHYLPGVEQAIDSTGVVPELETMQKKEGVLAFPGAVGYAKHAVGGRGGRVLVVNTVLNVVDAEDDFLSLREAVEVETGPRTIVFDVGGVFDTGKDTLNLLGEEGSNLTMACQTAPEPGVVIKTYGFNVQHGAHDIIFRHCAIRGIDPGDPMGQAGRSMTIRGGSYNILLDHMSLSWATDEGFQAYLAPNQTEGLWNITLSNSIVAEGDADSSHPESIDHPDWGYHAMGPSCLNNNDNFRPTSCSIVNNFIAHNSSRNAMIWGGSGELSNNIIYNWYTLGLYAKPFSKNDVDVIINNNLMKSGPNTVGATSNPACGPKQYRCAMSLGASDSEGKARYLVGSNYYASQNRKTYSAKLMSIPNATSVDGKPNFAAATPSNKDIRLMASPGSRHIRCVGASRPRRDEVDMRVINEFYAGTGAIGIGGNVRNGGHNVTRQRTWGIYGEPTSHPASYDSDKDGMRDAWEVSYGLNPNDSSDHAGDLDGDGYTNIEEFLAIAAIC